MKKDDRNAEPSGSHAKALWALSWRMLLLGPVVSIFGALAFLLVLGLGSLPFLAVIFVVSDDYLWAALALATWLLWLRFGGPVRRFVFEGFEHGSL